MVFSGLGRPSQRKGQELFATKGERLCRSMCGLGGDENRLWKGTARWCCSMGDYRDERRRDFSRRKGSNFVSPVLPWGDGNRLSKRNGGMVFAGPGQLSRKREERL